MTLTDIFTMITAIAASLSAIASLAVCFLTYKNSKPKIRFIPKQKGKQLIYFSYDRVSFAVVTFAVENSSAVAGVVDDVCIIYNGEKYYAEGMSSTFNPAGMTINFWEGATKQDIEKLHYKCPINVNGFSSFDGFLYFPTFPAVSADSLVVNITYRTLNSKRNHVVRRVTLFRVSGQIAANR